jgi:hypothetical protein
MSGQRRPGAGSVLQATPSAGSLERKTTSLSGAHGKDFGILPMSVFVLPTGAAGRNIAAARQDDLIARHRRSALSG